MRVWDTRNGQVLHNLPAGAPVNGVAFSPDGRLVAAAKQNGNVTIWQLQPRQPLHSLSAHTDLAYSVAFDPSGCILATGGLDRLVRLWNVETGELLAELGDEDTGGVLGLAFSDDGYLLVSSSASAVQLWGVPESPGATGDIIQVWPNGF